MSDPTLPADAADPRALVAFDAHADYVRRFTLAGGGDVLAEDGILCFASPHPLPLLVNGALRTDPATDPTVVLETAMAFFASRDRRFGISGLVGRDDDLLASLQAEEYSIGNPEPLQHLEISELSPIPCPPGIEIRDVVDAEGVREVAALNQDATRAYGMPEDLFETIFDEPRTVLMDGMHGVLAYDGQVPVATAQVLVTEDVAYVGWVAVASASMRRGLGTVVTSAVIERGRDAGASVAVLMASPMGAPVYRRMGFADVGVLRSAAIAPR